MKDAVNQTSLIKQRSVHLPTSINWRLPIRAAAEVARIITMGDGNLAESKQLNTDRVAFLWLNGRIPQWLSSKESACDAGDMGSISGSGRSPSGGHGNPLQYSSLENPMDRGAWWATVHRVTKSWT